MHFSFLTIPILIAYFVTHVAFASAVETNFWTERQKSMLALPNISLGEKMKWTTQTPLRFKEFVETLPQDAVFVQDTYEGLDYKIPPVVILQDVHLNLEAQNNIASVLQALIDHKKIEFVGIEGAFDTFDFGPFRSLPDKKIGREITQSFFENGILSAPSYVGIISKAEPPLFVGVDDRVHYDANVTAYLESGLIKNIVQKDLLLIAQSLKERKQKIFSESMLAFDKLRLDYEEKNISIGSYICALDQIKKSKAESSVITQFLKAYELESTLDFQQVERERIIAFKKLSMKLSQVELRSLMTESLAYRMGREGFGTYYNILKTLFAQKGVDLTKTPTFQSYIRYVLLSDGIKIDSLFNALGDLENEIVETFAVTSEEKKLAQESRYSMLVNKLINFELSSAEWNEYQRIKMAPIKMPVLKPFEEFYRQADIRSHAMLSRLMKNATKRNGGAPILIAGGFHSPLITQLLKERKRSYVLLTPKISKLGDGAASAYLSFFAREKTSLDKMFEAKKLFVYPKDLHISEGGTALRWLGSYWARFKKTSKVMFSYLGQRYQLHVEILKKSNAAQDKVTPSRSLYLLFGIWWEVVFQWFIPLVSWVVVYMGFSDPFTIWLARLISWMISAAVFAASHPDRKNGDFKKLFSIGLIFGSPFLFLDFWWASVFSLTTHSSYHAFKLMGFLKYMPFASIISKEKSKVPFYTVDGYDLSVYISLMEHIGDLPFDQGENFRRRFTSALENSTPESGLGDELNNILSEVLSAGFPAEPARLETLLHRQSQNMYQGWVEAINNGFDAMGDSLGRFGVGSFQNVGWLRDEGDQLEFLTIPMGRPTIQFRVTYKRVDGVIRVNFFKNEFDSPQSIGTEMILLKAVSAIDMRTGENWIKRKLGRSRRGLLLKGKEEGSLINSLEDLKTIDGKTPGYRLRDKVVRYWFVGDKELHIKDIGRGMDILKEGNPGLSSPLMESLVVPYESSNRTAEALQLSHLEKADPTNGMELLFAAGASDQTTVRILVGGTEVETLEIIGSSQSPELVIDLPTAAAQRESRDQIKLDRVTIRAINKLLDKLVEEFMKHPREISPVLNALVGVIDTLWESERSRESELLEDDLPNRAREKIRNAVLKIDPKWLVLPNKLIDVLDPATFTDLAALSLRGDLFEFNPGRIKGRKVASRLKSVWTLPLKPGAIFFRNGRQLFIDEKTYSDYTSKSFLGKGPLLLNLLFNFWTHYGEKNKTEVELSGIRSKSTVTNKIVNQQATPSTDMDIQRLISIIPTDQRDHFNPIITKQMLSEGPQPGDEDKLNRWATLQRLLGRDLDGYEEVFEKPFSRINAGKKEDGYFVMIRDGHLEHVIFRDRTGSSKIILSGNFAMQKNLVTDNRDILWGRRPEGDIFCYLKKNGEARTIALNGESQGFPREVNGIIYTIYKDKNEYSLVALGESGPQQVYLSKKENILKPEAINDRAYFIFKESGSWFLSVIQKDQTEILSSVPFPKSFVPDRLITFTGRVFIHGKENGRSIMSLLREDGSLTPVFNSEEITFWDNDDKERLNFNFKENGKWNAGFIDESGNLQIIVSNKNEINFKEENKGKIFLDVLEHDRWVVWMIDKTGNTKIFNKVINEKRSFNDLNTRGDYVYLNRVQNNSHNLWVIDEEGNDKLILSGQEKISVSIVGNYVYVASKEMGDDSPWRHSIIRSENPESLETFFLGGSDSRVYEIKDRLYFMAQFEKGFTLFIYEGSGNLKPILSNKGAIYPVTLMGDRIYVFYRELAKWDSLNDSRLLLINALSGTSAKNLTKEEESWINHFLAVSGSTPEQENHMMMNMLRFSWSGEELTNMGSLLAFVPGDALKRLEKETQEKIGQAISDKNNAFKQVIGSLLRRVAENIFDDKTFNSIVLRVLVLIGSDIKFARSLLESLSEEKTRSMGVVKFGFALLSPFLQASDIPLELFIVRYLRGEFALKIRPAEKEKVYSGSMWSGPLSTLAGVRGNITSPVWRLPDIQRILYFVSGYPATENKIARITGDRADSDWIRENIQNGLKAAFKADVDPEIEVNTFPITFNKGLALKVSISDNGIGMDAHDILHFLLALDRTSAEEGDNATQGYFGRGWYKNLNGADQIELVTGKKGDSLHYVLKAKKNVHGKWEASLIEVNGSFSGTVMSWYQIFNGEPDEMNTRVAVATVLIADKVQKYAGTLAAYYRTLGKKVSLKVDGVPIDQDITVLGFEPWDEKENLSFTRQVSGHRGVWQAGLFVMDLHQDPDLFSLLPADLKRVIDRLQLNLILPSSIPLNRERSGLAEKEKYIGKLQKKVLAALLKTIAHEIAHEEIPKDFFGRPEHLMMPMNDDVDKVATLFNQGSWEEFDNADVVDVLKVKQYTAQLVCALEIWNEDRSEKISLYELRKRIGIFLKTRKEIPSMERLPDLWQKSIQDALSSGSRRLIESAESDTWNAQDPDAETVPQKLLGKLISKMMTPLLNKNGISGEYRVSFGTPNVPRLAIMDIGWLALNLDAPQVRRWLEFVERLQINPIPQEGDYEILWEILELIVHEDVHAWERTGEETHNEAFYNRMLEWFIEMVKLRVIPEEDVRNMTLPETVPRGGLLLGLRSILLDWIPRMRSRYNTLWGPLIENALVFTVQGILILQGKDMLTAYIWSWGVYVLLHLIEWAFFVGKWIVLTWADRGRAPPFPKPFNLFSSIIIDFIAFTFLPNLSFEHL
ncbi:MAG: hypothetical protein ACKVQC_08330, partial [Elusimicrobiota bacterium]